MGLGGGGSPRCTFRARQSRRAATLPERILCQMRHPGLVQQRHVFALEAPPGMMRLLRLDVAPQVFNLRWTNADRSISILPRKTTLLLIQMAGRIGLEIPHELRNCQAARKRKQHMDMVRGTADRKSVSFAISGDAAKVTPKLAGFRDLWPAVFRAEDAVHQDFGVSVGHTDTLFPEVMGVGDSNHRRECRRSAARLSSYMLRGLTPPPKPIPPRGGWRVPYGKFESWARCLCPAGFQSTPTATLRALLGRSHHTAGQTSAERCHKYCRTLCELRPQTLAKMRQACCPQKNAPRVWGQAVSSCKQH